MNIQKLTLITAIVIGLAVVGLIVYQRLQPNPAPASASGPVELNYEGQPRLGPVDAPVTIAIFEDFNCPACRFFEETIFPQIERDYIRTGQAQLYFFNYQFLGPNSITAGLASLCAHDQNEAAFWEYKTMIYRVQEPNNQNWANPQRLQELASNIGDLDAVALRQCIDDRRFEERLTQNRNIGTAAGVQGTPSVFVNGVRIDNGNNFALIQSEIERVLGSN